VKFDADAIVPFPREQVFFAYRDDMPRAVLYMSGVNSIEVMETEDVSPGVRRYLKIWSGTGDIPAALKPFLPDGTLRWDDRVMWDQNTWSSSWTIRTHVFPDAISVTGTTALVEISGGRTRVELRGDFVVDARKLGNLPHIIAQPIARAAEAYLTRQITSNLATTSDAIARFLRESSENARTVV
jgi:hypothetical protein